MLKRDPHIRSYADTPPLIPGTLQRFRWPELYDSEVAMLRESVQEEARGLFLLRAPYYGEKLLVEAYYPEDIRDHYAATGLDPYRQEDHGMGRLVVVKVHSKIKHPAEPLDARHIMEIKRNNRNARRHLKRKAHAPFRALEIDDEREKRERPVFERWSSFYKDVQQQIRKYAMTPKVGPGRNLALGG